MYDNKEMPYGEKLEGILGFQELLEDFAPRLVSEELGKEKMDELQGIWQKESELIPKDASDKDKYEIAYRNFLQNWVSAQNFMSTHKSQSGDAGGVKFMHEAIEAWKRKYALSAFWLKIMWRISPKNAFETLAKRLAYQLQVFSPFTISQLNGDRMTLAVAPCKILDVRKRNDFCVLACQNIIPSWLEAQFNVKMSSERQGTNCTVSFSPFG